MTRRLKRTKDFELTLSIGNDSFINPPRDAQRAWLLNQAMKEFALDIQHLDTLARDFVSGENSHGISDRTQTKLSDAEIMEDWQIPIMQAMANAVVAPGDQVLEIGFGRGVASDFIQDHNPAEHVVIECNDSVVARFHEWRKNYPDRRIKIVHSLWQDAMAGLDRFDAIFFHTYPLNNEEFIEQIAGSVTFAEHFFETAAAHLNTDGCFTYLTNEIDSLSRAHQRALLKNFSSFTLSIVRGLKVPENTQDAMWGNSMVVVKAVK